MSEQFVNPEHQPHAATLNREQTLDMANRAALAPESLNGAMRHTLRGEGITIDPETAQPMGDNGPLAVLEIGNDTTLKLYGNKYQGTWNFALTRGNYVNDEVSDHAEVQNLVFVNKSMFFGRDVRNTASSLGLTKDRVISRNHFVIEPGERQVRIADISRYGTKVTIIEQPRATFGEAFRKGYQAHKLGGIAIEKPE